MGYSLAAIIHKVDNDSKQVHPVRVVLLEIHFFKLKVDPIAYILMYISNGMHSFMFFKQ